MSTSEIFDKEGRLLNFIEKLGPLVWRRYQQRYPSVWMKDHVEVVDRSSFPPYVSFRFKHERPEIADILRGLVGSYNGKLRWCLESHLRTNLSGRNWLIVPEDVALVKQYFTDDSITVYEYFAKERPLFGPLAYSELDNLTNHFEISLMK